MEEHNTPYFRNLWQINMSNLESQCTTWEKVCVDNEIPEEVLGEIRTTIGLARLLMKQKLKQFKGLIDDSEYKTGEKEITCSDLQGFWDMVYFEVEKLNKCFSKLDTCKNNEWKFIEENLVQKKVPVTKDITVAKKNLSKSHHAVAAKQRLAEVKQKMLAQRKQQEKISVEIIQASKQGSNHAKTVKADKPGLKKKLKNVDVSEVRVPGEEYVNTTDDLKQKAVQPKKRLISAQEKENSLPTDETSNFTNIPVTQTKSKGKSKASKPGKKEEIKLQCITRSAARRAMLASQNAL